MFLWLAGCTSTVCLPAAGQTFDPLRNIQPDSRAIRSGLFIAPRPLAKIEEKRFEMTEITTSAHR